MHATVAEAVILGAFVVVMLSAIFRLSSLLKHYGKKPHASS